MKKVLLSFLFFSVTFTGMVTAQDDDNFLAGEKAYAAGNYTAALEGYNGYIKTFEDKVPEYLTKLRTYDTCSLYERTALFPDFSIKHDWAVGYYKRGMANLNNSDFVQAAKDFDMSIDIDSKYAPPYLQKGLLLKGKGKNVACIYISKAHALSDTMRDAKMAYNENFCFTCGLEYFAKGKTEVNLKNYAEGLKNLNMAVQYCPDSGNYYAYRGMAYEGLSKLDSAIADYSFAIKIDSGSYMGYYRRALTYEKAQKYQDAFNDLNKALSRNPKFADAYLHQATDCENLSMASAALYDYQQVLKLKPNEGIAWYKVGMHKKQNGEDACDYFEKAADLGYDDAQSYADDCRKAAARKAMK